MEDCRKVERSQRIQHDDFMSRISIDGLIEWKGDVERIESVVESGLGGVCGGQGSVGESRDEFFEVTFTLSGGDGRSVSVVVVD